MSRVDLATIQNHFHALITAPTGVSDALRARRMTNADLATIIVSDDISATARLDVYANMYFYRILDVLRADFPAVLAALGEDGFNNVVTDYLLKHPSTDPNLGRIGERFSAFLAEPWVRDLATLEWARLELFDEVDEPLVTLAEVRALAPEQFIAFSPRRVAASRIIEVTHDVFDYWKRVDTGVNDLSPPKPQRGKLLIWRHGVDVFHRRLDETESAALAALDGGASLGRVCEEVAARLSAEEAGARAFGIIGRWVQEELLAHS